MSISPLNIGPVTRATLHQQMKAGHLYALLDACDAPLVPPKIGELGEERATSLYRGMPQEEEMEAVAPYLTIVDEELLKWIEENLWREPWGLFLVSSAPLSLVRVHFRYFLIVEIKDDPQRQPMYFRFYDPRVLRKYLPTCNEEELRQFFDGIEMFLLNTPEAETENKTENKAEEIEETLTGIKWNGRTANAAPLPRSKVRALNERFLIRAEQMKALQTEA